MLANVLTKHIHMHFYSQTHTSAITCKSKQRQAEAAAAAAAADAAMRLMNDQPDYTACNLELLCWRLLLFKEHNNTNLVQQAGSGSDGGGGSIPISEYNRLLRAANPQESHNNKSKNKKIAGIGSTSR
ncbi:uncharacterized protein LOC114803746 [Zeugodacus cucurbitae]|uniref:uncharacterized protein LOC114803746 n=1 Tax=Zeugodacus cucurbitae TaxID=28588 RepID=UPI0023D9478D|nr:uncharacterized protein LOC114803746 [Zeugodacus cucurbitae]